MRLDAPASRPSTPSLLRAPTTRRLKRRVGRIILVSNRGPVTYERQADGALAAERGAGGVVSGLLCALDERPGTWISLAMSEGDRAVAKGAVTASLDGLGESVSVRFAHVSAATYRRHYEGISNGVLWFAQHYLLHQEHARLFTKRTRSDWEKGYQVANDAVADAVIAELDAQGTDTPVVFQDYQLYLAPERVRAARPDAQLAHFTHIPWPEARYWDLLPEYMTTAIFRGLASNDLVGFQTLRDARNFLDGAERFLEGARVTPLANGFLGVISWQGRRIAVGAYPITITANEVEAGARTSEALAAAIAVSDVLPRDETHQVIMRVDRIEPTKNIVRGFEAYERLLERHEGLREKVTFLAFLVPSRQTMASYRSYERQVRATIERINARFERPGWRPIIPYFGNHRARALASMRRYNVLLVNPLIDGMNLVVKEGAIVNKRSGVIVLSRTAGAYEQLGSHVLGVSPTDVDATADALYTALTMPRREREERARGLRNMLLEDDSSLWLEAQLRDLARVCASPGHALKAVTSLGHQSVGQQARRSLTIPPRQKMVPSAIRVLHGAAPRDARALL